jgi:hypothetical protein
VSLSFTSEPGKCYNVQKRTLRHPEFVDRRGMLNSIVKELSDPACFARFPDSGKDGWARTLRHKVSEIRCQHF